MELPPRRKTFSIPCGRSCGSNPTSSGRELPSGRKCSIFGSTLIKLPEAFENAVLWNWSYRDSNRRPDASRGAMHRQSSESPPQGPQGPFAAGLLSNGGADPARSPTTRAGDPRVFEHRPGTTGSELASRGSHMASSVGKGHLTFGLVSFPIRLFSAARSETISFNLLHKGDHSRIKQMVYCQAEDKPDRKST